MSFYSEASLAYVASAGAGKDGKTYSMKPVDGTGDFTFSRGSNLAATRVGPTGLIEKGRENLLTYSNDFSQWTKINTTTTSGQSGYDGSSDATEVSFTAGSSRAIGKGGLVTSIVNFSIYVKAGTHDIIQFTPSNSATTFANFDISASNPATGNTGGLVVDSSIEDIGGGWYRCSAVLNNSGSGTMWIWIVDSLTSGRAASVSTDGTFFVQDAQLEIGLAATEVISTGATTGKAGLLEDEPRFDYSGGATCPSLLLEPSRTNLVKQSEYIHGYGSKVSCTSTPNYGTSPEGLTNSTRLQFTGNGYFYEAIPQVNGTQYTISVYAKRNDSGTQSFGFFVDGSGTIDSAMALTNEWKRFDYTYTATNASYFGFAGNSGADVSVYGFQQEAGSYPTSYIPNHSGGSVTRGADDSIVESLGYSSTCTFYYEFNTTTGRETSSPFAQVGKDNSNKFYIKGSSADIPQFQVQGNGIFSGSISSTNEISGTNKIAVQWSSGVGVVFSNGVKQSGTLTNSNTSENIDFISMRGNGTSHDSKQLLFFEEALSDADCITLTTI